MLLVSAPLLTFSSVLLSSTIPPPPLSRSFSSYSCYITSLPKAYHLKGILQRSVFQLFVFFFYTPSLILHPFSQGQIQILGKRFPNLTITSVVSLCFFTEKIYHKYTVCNYAANILYILCIHSTNIYCKYTTHDFFKSFIFMIISYNFLASTIF